MFDKNFRSQVEVRLRPVGANLRRTGLTADHLTVIGVLMAAGASVAIGAGALRGGLLLLVLCAVPDVLDGAVAKASGTASPRGAFFDSVCDRLSDALLLGGVAWFLATTHDGRVSVLPLAVLGLSMLISYERAKAEALGFDARGGIMERAERLIALAFGLLFDSLLIATLWVMLVLTAATFESYARYWIESFRLPGTPPEVLDAGIIVEGWSRVEAVLEQGSGAILALPHLGGWEWAGFWCTTSRRIPMTVVVEALEPPDLYEWFVALRESFGMHVVPLGPRAGSEVLAALRKNHVVCLLCDRDIGGGGVEVDFLGERTTLPAGPATLALRSGAPLFPTAVYYGGERGRIGVVRPALDLTRTGRLRHDVARLTQSVADELAELIRQHPEQWHLLQPNWPSDRAETGA